MTSDDKPSHYTEIDFAPSFHQDYDVQISVWGVGFSELLLERANVHYETNDHIQKYYQNIGQGSIRFSIEEREMAEYNKFEQWEWHRYNHHQFQPKIRFLIREGSEWTFGQALPQGSFHNQYTDTNFHGVEVTRAEQSNANKHEYTERRFYRVWPEAIDHYDEVLVLEYSDEYTKQYSLHNPEQEQADHIDFIRTEPKAVAHRLTASST